MSATARAERAETGARGDEGNETHRPETADLFATLLGRHVGLVLLKLLHRLLSMAGMRRDEWQAAGRDGEACQLDGCALSGRETL